MSDQNISITKTDLKEMITAAITAAKAPNVVEQAQLDAQQRQIKADQENRLKISGEVKQEAQNKKWQQSVCSHEHKNGDTHCVFVHEQRGTGYLLCQKNQCIIRPGDAPKKYEGPVIYNTELFNRIFQKTPGSGDIFG